MSDDQFYQEILKDAEEGIPKILTPDPDDFNQRIYAKQRRSRLGDCIGDYFGDDSVDARQFYEELLAELEELREYHQSQADRVDAAKQLVLGHRDVTL